jgi:hypothetical protein
MGGASMGDLPGRIIRNIAMLAAPVSAVSALLWA